MARSLRVLLLFAVTLVSAVVLPPALSTARAAELDKKGKADAKEAMRLYKGGDYEDAAKVFARLSVNYPDMLVFVRNLGACYYYLRRWEPAISNLRDYEHRKKDIAGDDHDEIAGWIGEMERLRDQAALPSAPTAAPPAQAATAPVAPAPPVAAPLPGQASEPVPPGSAATATPTPPAASEGATVAGATTAAAESVPVPVTDQPQAYPPAQWGAQSAYPPGPYAAQPTYPQTQYPYGAPSGAAYPTAPGYPQGYPPGTNAPVPAGEVATAPASPGAGRSVAAWVLGLTGATAVGIGALCTLKALDDFSKVQKKYDPALEDEGKRLAVAQWIGYGVGGALLVTAIVVGTSGGGSSSGVALAPVVGPGSAGATLAGTF